MVSARARGWSASASISSSPRLLPYAHSSTSFVAEQRLQPRRLLGAAAVRAAQAVRCSARGRRRRGRVHKHVRDSQRARDLVEVDVERRGDDHDVVSLASVPRDPVARLGRDRRTGEPRAERAGPRRRHVGTVRPPAPASARAPWRASRSPRPGRAREAAPTPRRAARATVAAPGDARSGTARACRAGSSCRRSRRRRRSRVSRSAIRRAGAGTPRPAGAGARSSRSASRAGPTRRRGPRAMPRTIASATASGVTESGAAFMPSVIFVCTNPGRTIMHVHAARRERRREALVVAVDAGLRRAVHEVRPAHAFARDRREQHERAVALRAQPFDERHRHRDRAGEVGLHDLERGRGDRARRAPGRPARRTRPARGRSRRSDRTSRRTKPSCDAKSVASNATASHLATRRPRAARRPRASHASGLRAASTTRAPRRATSLRTVASAMSEVPPSTSTDCTSPSASFTGLSPSRRR